MKIRKILKWTAIALVTAFSGTCLYAVYEYRQLNKAIEEVAIGIGKIGRALSRNHTPDSMYYGPLDTLVRDSLTLQIIRTDSLKKMSY